MNKAVFLDRDGTINIDLGYVHEKDKLEFIPGVLEALAEIQAAGFKLIIITNQSGIGRGYFTLEQYKDFEKFMLDQMAKKGVIVDGVYFCPHGPQEHCNCRKPSIWLYEQAARDFNIDWKSSFVVGDSERDLAVCNIKDIQGIFFSSIEKRSNNIISCNNWKEIMQYILRVV